METLFYASAFSCGSVCGCDWLYSALAAGEFVLYYQPKVNLAPDTFLPLIEEHLLAIDIGEWVIDTALSQVEYWHTTGLNIPVSANIGARQLQQESFIKSLRTLRAAHPAIKWGDLELEILKISAIEDLNKVSQLIAACRKLGIKLGASATWGSD